MKIKDVEFETIANLMAFLSVLGTIAFLATDGVVSNIDLSIMTGLIGVLGSFRPWLSGSKTVAIDQPAGDPIPVTQTPAGAAPVADPDELPESEKIA